MAGNPTEWAKLVPLGQTVGGSVSISNENFTIGRSADCSLSFENNKLVSQLHCKITREDDSVYLLDSSTNGTQVDGSRVKQNRVELNHGDEIHIVFKKGGKENNIAYTFELTRISAGLDGRGTLEYDIEDPVDDEGAPESKRRKTSSDEKPDLDSSGNAGKSASVTGIPSDPSSVDAMEENLLCSICQELLHDAVSLQPCLHTFCAGCFSSWMERSTECPSCRKSANAVAQNHIVRNLVETYLKSNPGKRRPKTDTDELDARNKIKELIVKLSRRSRFSDSYLPDEDEASSYGSEDEESISDPGYGDGFSSLMLYPSSPARLPVCRECPGHTAYAAQTSSFLSGIPTLTQAPGGPASGAMAGTNDPVTSSTTGTTPPRVCVANGRHIVCYCCMQPLPDRRSEATTPSVTCSVCDGIYCHMYWGCQKSTCRGCLSTLNAANLDESLLDSILMQNHAESTILKNYLSSQSKGLADVLTETCAALDRGDVSLNNDFNCQFTGRQVRGSSVVCYKCASKAFRQLAYHYRSKIDPTDLPDEVTRKEDCYWGKNCRTQNKPHHAQKWNHICEQTRFR